VLLGSTVCLFFVGSGCEAGALYKWQNIFAVFFWQIYRAKNFCSKTGAAFDRHTFLLFRRHQVTAVSICAHRQVVNIFCWKFIRLFVSVSAMDDA